MEISYKRIKKEKNPAQDFSLHGILPVLLGNLRSSLIFC